MATRPVTDTIRHSDGSVWANATVTFRLWLPSYTGTAAYPTELVTVTTAPSTGVYTATLWCDEEGVQPTSYQVTYPDGSTFFIDIPVGDGSTVQMSALRTAAPGVPAVNLQTLLDALTFLKLIDVPHSYTGQSGKTVAVNPGETALEFISTTGGAPANADYVTLSANATLSNEQVLGTAVIMLGTAAGRPAAATAGRLYYATDTGVLSRDGGSSWLSLAHHTTHELGGSDAIQIAESQVTNLVADLAAAGAPKDATYITQTPNGTLSAEQALSLLASGYVKNTTATGVLTVQATPLPIGDLPVAASGVSDATKVTRSDDSRLSDARTPVAHHTTHESGGSDVVTLAESQITNLTTDLAAKAPLASPTFTGVPAAPTAAGGTNTTQLATTAFVAAVTLPESQITNLTTDLAAKLAKASNLSDVNSAATSRVNLGVDVRTTFSNANYTALATDKYIAQIGTLSASRTVTLPAANAVNAGQIFWLEDESNTVTPTNTIVIARAGSDTINGGTSFTLAQPFKMVRLISDGVSKWFAELSLQPTVVDFTSSGSSVIPAGCTTATLIAVGAGAGGGSGRRGAAGTVRGGGGGGGGGSVTQSVFQAADLGGTGATLTVTIGAGGIGNAGKTVDSTDGSAGGAGGITTIANGNLGINLVAGAGGGGGGTTSGGTAGFAGPVAIFTGGAGGAGGASGAGGGAGSGSHAPGGGGGGGGISAADAHFAGAGGGLGDRLGTATNGFNAGGTAGTLGGGLGGNPTAPNAGTFGAGGAGGGGSNNAGAGGNGGNGTRGGGGGGGGASVNGNNSGSGGNGGDGWARIIYQ